MLHESTEISISLPPKETHSNGPGSRLRKIRETKHLSIDEMAKRLRLTRERLVQIENDDYHQMGASAFARGYIRSYAGQLGIAKSEITDILKSFDELNFGAEIPTNKPQLIHEKIDHTNPKVARRIGSLLILLALVLVGYWWYSHNTNLLAKPAPEATPVVSNNEMPIPPAPQPQPVTSNNTNTSTGTSTGKAELEVLPAISNVPLPALSSKTVAPAAATPTPEQNSDKAR